MSFHPDGNFTRRLDLGLALLAEGDGEAAADALRAALALDPAHLGARFKLGEALALAGDRDGADAAFREVLARDPADPFGAAVSRHLLGTAPPPDRLPATHVTTLFDQYAPRFEKVLVDSLHYCGHVELARVLRARWPGRVWASALDLGCGTGLSGAELRPLVGGRLEGWDLSAEMLALARDRRIYNALAVRDLAAGLPGLAEESVELIAAADTLIYLGDLAPLVQDVARALAPGGTFAATFEAAPDPEGFDLPETRRYRHGAGYLGRVVAAAGLQVAALAPITVRRERREPVPGAVLVAERPQPSHR